MRTNIYGTIGPACRSEETLRRLFAEGMTGVRLNLSHTSLADAADWIANIHHAYESQSGGAGIDRAEILMDLQEPELRIGTLRSLGSFPRGRKSYWQTRRERGRREQKPFRCPDSFCRI